jgi:hypothetical protein
LVIKRVRLLPSEPSRTQKGTFSRPGFHPLHHYVPLCLAGALGNAKLVSDLFIQQTGNTTSLMTVMYAKAPYTVIQRAMHIHPTVAEYLPTVLSKLEPLAGFR